MARGGNEGDAGGTLACRCACARATCNSWCFFVYIWQVFIKAKRQMCVPVRHRVPVLIARLLLKAVTGVNLMRAEGKARSADRHRRDHSLQCT